MNAADTSAPRAPEADLLAAQKLRASVMLSHARIVQEPLPPIEWDVEPLIAHEDRVMLYGAFGSFKSWLLLHLAIHLAAGRDWLGFPIPRSRTVLYIDEEMNPRTLRRRVKRLDSGAGFEGDLPLEYMSRQGIRLNEEGAQKLLLLLKQCAFDPGVVIVETLRRVLVGHENDSQQVGAFWLSVEPILRSGRTLIVSHHMKKPQGEGPSATRDQASGSTDLLAGADAGFGVWARGDNVVVVEGVKARESEIARPFGVRLHLVDPDGPVEIRPEEIQEQKEKWEQAVEQIVDFLLTVPDQKARTADIVAYLATQGVERRTAERALAATGKAGKIVQVRQGLWRLPEA